MKEITLEAKPYLVIWAVLFVVYLLGVLYYFWKKHPETFASNTDPELKQKYQRRLKLSVTMVFIWIAGIEVIYSLIGTATTASWFVFGVALLGVLISRLGIIKNSKTRRTRPRIYTAREMEGMGLRDPRGKKEDPWDDDDGYC